MSVHAPGRRVAAAASLLLAALAQAQPQARPESGTASSPTAQPAARTAASAASGLPAAVRAADPLDPRAEVPAWVHRSSLADYRARSPGPAVSWKDANDTVNRIGGWRTYAREAQAAEAVPTPRARADTPAAVLPEPARPAGPASGHGGHGRHSPDAGPGTAGSPGTKP